VQVSVNARLLPDWTTFRDPLRGCDPVQSPLAMQDVALAALHVRVADWPGSTELGLTEMVNLAAGGVGGGAGVL
jgi:hypothetical protein